jgi:hypothetical protein
MAAPFYLHNIPSLHEKHAHLPPTLAKVDLSQGIHQGAPINPANLTHARAVANMLDSIHSTTL